MGAGGDAGWVCGQWRCTVGCWLFLTCCKPAEVDQSEFQVSGESFGGKCFAMIFITTPVSAGQIVYMGMGQNKTTRGTAGFSPSFHLPGFHLGYLVFDPQPYIYIYIEHINLLSHRIELKSKGPTHLTDSAGAQGPGEIDGFAVADGGRESAGGLRLQLQAF